MVSNGIALNQYVIFDKILAKIRIPFFITKALMLKFHQRPNVKISPKTQCRNFTLSTFSNFLTHMGWRGKKFPYSSQNIFNVIKSTTNFILIRNDYRNNLTKLYLKFNNVKFITKALMWWTHCPPCGNFTKMDMVIK